MRCYVWFNPVTLQLFNKNELNAAARRLGFEPVECEQDHIAAVKEKYNEAIRQAEGMCVADMRCPEACRQVRERWGDERLVFPAIHPILIHCAMELRGRLCTVDSMLFITTPCKSLRDYGNDLGLPNTRFLTWNEFEAEHGISLPRKKLSGSPIPPGFFEGFGESVLALSSIEEIEGFFLNHNKELPTLIELLFCKNGCHNGDGILEEEVC